MNPMAASQLRLPISVEKKTLAADLSGKWVVNIFRASASSVGASVLDFFPRILGASNTWKQNDRRLSFTEAPLGGFSSVPRHSASPTIDSAAASDLVLNFVTSPLSRSTDSVA